MSDIDTQFEGIVAAEKTDAECQVPNYSRTAKHWCTKTGHWLIRQACGASGGAHTSKLQWWICCDGCREVFEALTLHCPTCRRECYIEVDVL